MGWTGQGIITANAGDIIHNITFTTPNQVVLVNFPNSPFNSVDVYGYLIANGNEKTPFGINAEFFRCPIYYNATLVTVGNPDLDGSLQFYRPKTKYAPLDVEIYRLDP